MTDKDKAAIRDALGRFGAYNVSPEVRRVRRELEIRAERETFVPAWSLEDTRD